LLIESIRRELAIKVVMLEGPDEAGVGEEIASRIDDPVRRPSVVRLVGNLGAAGALLEAAAVYVGSDSGLAHVSAAVGTRAVTVFGPADPDRVCPFGCRDLVVRPDVDCGPCFLYPWESTYPKVRCGRDGQPMCITRITVEQVMTAVRRAMSQIPSPSGRG
jgi:ADP-heptose:LPS heptosyltransferase